ncbi:MAG: SDR family NAD(P)-dependent oxidoreductase, partial [Planococcus sp. (in: firmicutes)]|nr:SDR family NAD(P)-dependent oxidoreductase [Planococcus sp. (in: firmicutes)]
MLSEQTIIVTGGSSGMGFHMAEKFATEGANVVITGRDMEKLNESLT